MSASFEIKSSTGRYAVEIRRGLYGDIFDAKADSVVICDERFAPDFEKAGMRYIALAADETVKSLNAIPDVIVALRKHGVNRGTRLIAAGGGIVQDVAAFCAAIYMRGLDWHYMPTTLLGMADSCIGGKSSINVGEYKNIVGTFNPPSRVLIDPDLALTLSAEQIVAGLVEAAKICYCRNPESWKEYFSANPSLQMDADKIAKIIGASLAAKKWFIETDEFDKKERLLLNFGHTFGHALEGASHFGISHGIAVGVGMLCALALGRYRGLKYESCRYLLDLEKHIGELLREAPGLSAALQVLDVDDLFDRFKVDKKHAKDSYKVVMPASDGTIELIALAKTPDNEKAIKTAMAEVLKNFPRLANRAA